MVSAGLDILTRQLSAVFVASEGEGESRAANIAFAASVLPALPADVLETLSDMSVSATAAICILDDLLHYESVDAGTFKVSGDGGDDDDDDDVMNGDNVIDEAIGCNWLR